MCGKFTQQMPWSDLHRLYNIHYESPEARGGGSGGGDSGPEGEGEEPTDGDAASPAPPCRSRMRASARFVARRASQANA